MYSMTSSEMLVILLHLLNRCISGRCVDLLHEVSRPQPSVPRTSSSCPTNALRSQTQLPCSAFAACRSVIEVPSTGFLESFYEGQDFCVSVNNARVNDPRDVNSLYANTRNSCQRRTIFNFVPTDGGYFLQAADIRTAAGPEANGWWAYD